MQILHSGNNWKCILTVILLMVAAAAPAGENKNTAQTPTSGTDTVQRELLRITSLSDAPATTVSAGTAPPAATETNAKGSPSPQTGQAESDAAPATTVVKVIRDEQPVAILATKHGDLSANDQGEPSRIYHEEKEQVIEVHLPTAPAGDARVTQQSQGSALHGSPPHQPKAEPKVVEVHIASAPAANLPPPTAGATVGGSITTASENSEQKATPQVIEVHLPSSASKQPVQSAVKESVPPNTEKAGKQQLQDAAGSPPLQAGTRRDSPSSSHTKESPASSAEPGPQVFEVRVSSAPVGSEPSKQRATEDPQQGSSTASAQKEAQPQSGTIQPVTVKIITDATEGTNTDAPQPAPPAGSGKAADTLLIRDPLGRLEKVPDTAQTDDATVPHVSSTDAQPNSDATSKPNVAKQVDMEQAPKTNSQGSPTAGVNHQEPESKAMPQLDNNLNGTSQTSEQVVEVRLTSLPVGPETSSGSTVTSSNAQISMLIQWFLVALCFAGAIAIFFSQTLRHVFVQVGFSSRKFYVMHAKPRDDV